MNRTLRIAALGVGLCICAAPNAYAQMKWTDRGFFNVNVGAQAPSQELNSVTTPEIYGDPANIRSSQDVAGGAFFEFDGGYKVWKNLVVGIGYSRVASKADLSIDAQIPDPDVTDSPRHVTTTAPDAHHSQNALNFTGTWMMPVTDKIDVGYQFGPTIFFASQDLPGDLQIQEPTPVITSTGLRSEDKTTVGIHFGIDATYLVTPRYGVGVLVRYSWGSADFGSDSVTLGGFQIGFGARVRF